MLAIHLDSQVVGYSLVGKKLIRSDVAYFIWAMSKAVLNLIICWVNEELIKFVRDFRLDLGQTWVNFLLVWIFDRKEITQLSDS